MKKFLIIALALVLSGVSLAGAHAQGDTIIIDDGDDSVIEGTITDVRFDYVHVEVNGENISVDTDDLGIDNNLEDYFPIGTRVQVIGDLDQHGEMEARKMIKLEAAAAPEVQVITE